MIHNNYWSLFLLFGISTCLLLAPAAVHCEKLLFLLPIASTSHKNIFQPIYHGLAQRGHEVTVVSPARSSKSQQQQHPSIREIVPVNMSKYLSSFGDPIARRREGKLKTMAFSMMFVFSACRDAFENQELMSLLGEKFDLVFIDGFMNDCFLGFIYRLGAPFVSVTTIAAPNYITQLVGNRLPPSFVPSPFFSLPDEMTFWQRVQNVVLNLGVELVFQLVYVPRYESIYREFLGEDVPGWKEIYGNVSMIFMNSHFTTNYPRPTLPDVIEIGGIHCKPAEALPKDIEEFVSEAEHGVILFSLGTVIQPRQLGEDVRKMFLNVFSRLKQRVLWKWDAGKMPNLPKNVMLRRFLPQQNILGHEKTKLFITHGGLLSTQEAIYHGVPLLGFPVFGDQDLNMEMAEKAGFALTIDILELTEEILEDRIKQVLQNPMFSQRVEHLSKLYRDQMQSPSDTAIFWTEYMLRHHGAPHLRSASRKLNFFQYHSIDVFVFLIVGVCGILWAVEVLLVKVVGRLLRRKTVKKKVE